MSDTTVNVRIRHEDEAKSVALCTWDPAKLDELIRLLGSWGVSYDYSGEGVEISGQFVVADGEAFFEVLLHAPDDAS